MELIYIRLSCEHKPHKVFPNIQKKLKNRQFPRKEALDICE